MRPVLAAAQAVREAREGTLEIPMLWIEGKDRESGAAAGIGLWAGPDTESIWVVDMFTGASVRHIFYHQAVIELGSFRAEAGLGVQATTVTLSSISAAVQQAIRGYEARGAKVQVWKRCYDPWTQKPLGVEAVFKGYANTATIERPEPGGEGTVALEIVSTARLLTIASAMKKSHEAQKRRSATDTFRRWKSTAKSIDIAWGTKTE